MKTFYDNKSEIAIHLASLPLFQRLQDARSYGVSIRGDEPLNEFVVMGRFLLRNDGKLMKFFLIPKDYFPDIPDVLTAREYQKFVVGYDNYSLENIPLVEFLLPPCHLLCPDCCKGWDMDNCHDVHCVYGNEIIDLSDSVGIRLSEIIKEFALRTDGEFTIRFPARPLLHDRFIDLTLVSQGKLPAVPKNKLGWAGLDQGITKHYEIQQGDKGGFKTKRYYHHACYEAKVLREEKENLRTVLEEAGFSVFRLDPIASRYERAHEFSPPWFLVTLEQGASIIIGRRTCVVNIDWSGTEFRGSVTDDDVTKSDINVHADCREKEVEYLSALRERMGTLCAT